jgi:DNA-binding LacI/PurR family transcriptional regulator
VSKGAVSFALNGRPGVGEATRARILAIATELGWQPNTRARALSSRRAFAVGLIMGRPAELLGDDPFFAQFLAGVETVLADHGYALVLEVVAGNRTTEAASYRALATSGRVDGVFILDPRRNDLRFELVDELRLPAVVVGQPVGPCGLPAVATVERTAMAQAVDHLLALGHRRIAHVSGPPGLATTAVRRTAWRAALRAAGVEPGPVVAGDFTAAGGRRATQQLLEQSPRPTAIVYANDLMAIAGVAAASELGVDVPADLSIVGHDDVSLAPYLTPPLTTVHQDVMALGAASARTLVALVERNDPPVIDLEDPALVVRASTGPPRDA